MLNRTLVMAMVCLAIGAPARGSNLDAQLFPLTGEIRLRNSSASAVPLAFYSITSASGALNSSALVWKSITDNYDASGNGFIDLNGQWVKLSAISTQLTEGIFIDPLPESSLPAFRSVSLGQIWSPALYPAHDLAFSVFQPDAQQVTVAIQFAVAGDYNSSGSVTSADYTVWRQNFGSTTNLNADGNLNGIVDAADYVVWRNNFGLSLPGAGSGGGSSLSLGGAVPEPAAAILMLCAVGGLLTARARAPRVARRAADRSSVRR